MAHATPHRPLLCNLIILPPHLKNIQWDCIHFVPDIDSISLDDGDYKIVKIDASRIASEIDLLKVLAAGLNFPDYFGENWDALDECLRDLEWFPSERGWVLIVENSKQLWKENTELAGKLIKSWLMSAEEWSKEQKSFHLVFVLN